MNVKKESLGKNGLENMDLLTAQLNYIKNNILKTIFKHPNSWPFHKPVDVVQLDLPDYYSIIKKPMDMGTIQQKIDSQRYSSAQECINDFRLMCANCYLYNGPNDEVVLMCREMETIFDKKIVKMPTELNHVKRGRARNSLPGPLPRPAATPTPNGSVAGGSSSLNSIQHVDKEPKVVLSNPSFVPVMPKISNTAEHNRLESDASLSVAALTSVSARDTPATHKTHSFVGGSSVASASKTKKTMKRKAEDNPLMRAVLETPRSAPPSQPIASAPPPTVAPAPLPSERRDSSGRSSKRAKKETSEDHTHHSQQQSAEFHSKRLPTEALTHCHRILLQLFQKPLSTAASHFYNCVDAKTPGMENYFDIIKRPMSLLTVKKNLENNVYHRSTEFAKDMRQIFTNCYRFYSPEEEIVRAAKTVQDFFELNFAKAPDDPPELMPAALPVAAAGCGPVVNRAQADASDFEGSSSESSCNEDNYDSDQEKREAKLKLLQDQLFQVQQEVMRLSQHLEKGKKKKSKKSQDVHPEVAVSVPPEQPLVHAAAKTTQPAVKPQTKPAKPARTKFQAQKKALGPPRTVSKPPPVAMEPVDIPKSLSLPPPSSFSPSLYPSLSPPSPPRPPYLPPPPPPLQHTSTSASLSHEEQNQLREDISRLSEDAQYSILQIIRNQGTSLNVSGDEIVIDFETLNPSTIMEMQAFVAQCSKDSVDKVVEPRKLYEDPGDISAVDEQGKPDKIGTLDDSPVSSTGHLLPQQPMRPSTTAAPKPPSRMLNVPPAATSSYGSQIPQPMPELMAAIPPSSAAVETKPVAVARMKSKSPLVVSQDSAFPKDIIGPPDQQKVLPGGDRRPPPDNLPDKPLSPSASSLAAFSRKPSSKSLLNNSEDSSSPKTNAKLGGSQMSLGTGVKPGTPAVGPFGIDMSKAATQKESTSKPSTTGWSFASLAANTHQTSTPKPVTQQQTTALQFNRFKRIAAERQERERMDQEKEAMRQQRLRTAEEERERRRKNEQKVRGDEESSGVSNSSEPQTVEPQAIPAAVAAAVEAKAKDNQLSEQQLKEQERLREQQRRRMEAQSNKIDMNFQSDLLASFESNYRLNSTL